MPPTYAPYAQSHVIGARGQASKGNSQLQNLSCMWWLPQTLISTAVNLHADPANTDLAQIVGRWLISALDVVGWVDVDAGTPFTDETTDAASAGAGDVVTMAAPEAVGDYLLFGHRDPFGAMELIVGTAGTVGVGTWEYLRKDGVWSAFSFLKDGSSGFQAAATDIVQWEFPEDWGPVEPSIGGLTTAIMGRARYWVRFRITTVYTINPVASRIRCYPLNAAAAQLAALGNPRSPQTGVITHLHHLAATASGSNNDTILEILNLTRQKRGRVTITKAINEGRWELSQKVAVQKGDAVIIRGLQEDGTTEYQTVALGLEIAA